MANNFMVDLRFYAKIFGLLAVTIIAAFVLLIILDSPYLGWDYSDPERAVVGVLFHAFEWIFVRLTPVALIGSMVGIYLTGKKQIAMIAK